MTDTTQIENHTKEAQIDSADPWEHDQLNFQEIGHAFTNLVQSLDTSQVISIEAGFGRGKTFFRKAWAEHLRRQGEIVIEIDALASDHSNDPMITLLGAMMEHIDSRASSKLDDAKKKALKLGGLVARTVARAALRHGAEELIEHFAQTAQDAVDNDTMDKAIDKLGEEMTTAADHLIRTQLAAERIRTKEMPAQLEHLRDALRENDADKKIVIIIDELDRCHPDYAIALLETLKLAFDMKGFAFILMVNPDYLEHLAAHRFGQQPKGEKYLDKFVNLRIQLVTPPEAVGDYAHLLTSELNLKTPFAPHEKFKITHAADLAKNLAIKTKVPMRKLERIIEKVDLTLRCYRNTPLDASLLILLAFQEWDPEIEDANLPRAKFIGRSPDPHAQTGDYTYNERASGNLSRRMDQEKCDELRSVPQSRYRMENRKWFLNYFLRNILPQTYFPEHIKMLNASAQYVVADEGADQQ